MDLNCGSERRIGKMDSNIFSISHFYISPHGKGGRIKGLHMINISNLPDLTIADVQGE